DAAILHRSGGALDELARGFGKLVLGLQGFERLHELFAGRGGGLDGRILLHGHLTSPSSVGAMATPSVIGPGNERTIALFMLQCNINYCVAQNRARKWINGCAFNSLMGPADWQRSTVCQIAEVKGRWTGRRRPRTEQRGPQPRLTSPKRASSSERKCSPAGSWSRASLFSSSRNVWNGTIRVLPFWPHSPKPRRSAVSPTGT